MNTPADKTDDTVTEADCSEADCAVTEADCVVIEHDDALIVECDLPDPPEKVWRALTEPELVAQWLTADEEGTREDAERGPGCAVRANVQYAPDDAEHASEDAEHAPDDATHASEAAEHARDNMRPAPVECEVIEARPNRLVRYRWQDRDDDAVSVDSIVTFELSRTATGGTHLRLIHTPVQTATVMRLAA